VNEPMIGVWLGIGMTYVVTLITGFLAGFFASQIKKKTACNTS